MTELRTRTKYKYDAENRLIEIDYVGTSNKSAFAYDGLGHRVSDAETVSGTTTTTYYEWCPSMDALSSSGVVGIYGVTASTDAALVPDGLHQTGGGTLCQTRNSSQTAIRRDLAEGEYNVSSGQKLIYSPDQLQSVRDVLDGTSGSLVQSYDYAPYGAIVRSNGTTPTDFGYAGLFYHQPSGLNFADYRALDGVTGRWTNRDPVREAGGINLYLYAGAQPTKRIDPRGLYLELPITDSPANLALPQSSLPFNPTLPFSFKGPGGETITMGQPTSGADQCTPRNGSNFQTSERDCYAECAHLLPSPSGDLQGSEFRKCYGECSGRL